MKKRVITVNGVRILEGENKAMRDPRKDPRPGDVVLLVDGSRAEVDFIRDGYIGVWLREKRCVRVKIEVWRKDCEGAEVLHVAD